MWTPNTYTPARGPQTTNLYDSAFFVLSSKMLVYTCFAAHMCRAIWPVAIWLHTQRSNNTVFLWRFHTTHTDVLESMSLGHYKYSGLRATCHLPLQIQWSESSMIRNIGICSSILLVYTTNSTHVQRNAYTPGLCGFLKIYKWLVYTQKSGVSVAKSVYTRLLGEWHCRHRAPKSETCSFIGPKQYTPNILQKSENVKTTKKTKTKKKAGS